MGKECFPEEMTTLYTRAEFQSVLDRIGGPRCNGFKNKNKAINKRGGVPGYRYNKRQNKYICFAPDSEQMPSCSKEIGNMYSLCYCR